MSNLPIQSAVNHNDDNDEQINSINNKLSTINTRIITTPSLIKRQQNIETKIANNQAYDEIHDLRTKHSSSKKINNDNLYIKNSTQQYQSHELMQGNYYDQTRFVDIDYTSSSNHQSEPILIDINVEDYKKTFAPVCTSKNSNNKNRTRSPPFGDTSESIQQGIAQSAGILLELNKKQDNYHQHKTTMKNNNKSHEQAVINYFPNDDDDDNNNNNTKQRSSSSSSSSSDCSTSDSSTSNKCQDDNTQTNIPYEKLSNDEDNDDNNELIETTKKPLTESTILLNKNHSQTYGTQQSTTNIPYERSKYLPNNGYNSHGSSVTTKSSSDNSGSIRTNSGTDNDEESDEEHYNNSTLSNNQYSTTLPRTKDTSIKSLNKTHDIKYSYINEQNNYRSSRLNTTHLEQTNNNDEFHLQVPRMKQLNIDDLNGNVNKLNPITTDHNTILFPSKSSLQQSSNNQTNIPLPSSSHQNRNITEHNEQQQQQQQQHLNSSRNTTTRPNQNRGSKKRKQSQQQEIIRTELIPGHRGDRDVDELVMFIDGDSSKQQQNSTHLRPTDTNKPRLSSKLNSLNDTNSNKTSSRKKSRKSMNILQQTISTTTNNNENQTSNYVTTNEQNIQSLNFINEDNQTKTHTIIDITNQSLINKNISTDNNNDDESHLNAVDVNSTKIINDESSIPNLFEQTHNDNNTSLKNDDIDLYNLSSIITNNLNSEIISEPFVTVKNRRRLIKERRQDNNLLTRSTHFLPPSTSSKTYDKRRISSTTKNGIIRPILRNNLPNTKVNIASITKEEINNRISSEPVRSVPPLSDEQLSSTSIVNSTNEQNIEKQQISPRLSSHSSSSSLSSLLKRQSKPPPVVFLNKSIDIELNDVSFGFELDSTTLTKSSDDNNIDTNNQPSIITTTTEPDIDTSTSLSIQQIQSNDISNDSSILISPRRFSQRNNRSPQFYSGSDIRPHQQRNYSSQSSYIDPLLLVQYNQQRLANYSQQLAYMNYLRTHYIPPQSPYVLLPTTYTTTTTTTTNEIDHDETTNSSTSEQIQEPLYVYSTPTGQFYFHPSTTKKSSIDTEQQSNSMPTVYTPTIYPSHYFYPSHTQHLIPSQTAYFQPISSSSSLIDTKSEQNNIDIDDDDGYKNSSILYHQTRQQSSSSDIMSNALQLVYSQQRRNAQTDRFNLDDLTAYLAMKWTDTVDHYEQGDNRILLVNEQE